MHRLTTVTLLVTLSFSSIFLVSPIRAEISGTGSAIGGSRQTVSATSLSPNTVALAKSLGIWSEMQRLAELRAKRQGSPPSTEEWTTRQDLTEQVLIVDYDIDSVANRIDVEVARANEIHAYLSERRDRAIRINTYTNFISGGLTGIVGGAMSLGNLPSVAPNTLDTTEGVIQTTLATWALKQQHGERRMESGVPNMLAKLFYGSADTTEDYPDSVWMYLNSAPANSANGQTRLQTLISRWQAQRLCLVHKGHGGNPDTRVKHLTGTHDTPQRTTIGLLADRIAMLLDLRSTVAEMDQLLADLMQFIHGSKSLN